jgi:hypothetical protein
MIAVAALWIILLLGAGGFALDRVLTSAITRNFDDGLSYVLTSMAASAEIDDLGEVRLIRPLGDQRFLEVYSGLYWQISGPGYEPFRSRSLWDRALKIDKPCLRAKIFMSMTAASSRPMTKVWSASQSGKSSSPCQTSAGVFRWRRAAPSWTRRSAQSATRCSSALRCLPSA